MRHSAEGTIRQAHLLGALAARADVDLVMAGDPPAADIVARVAKLYRVERSGLPALPVTKLGRRLRDLRIAAFGRQPFEVMMEAPARRDIEAMLPDPSAYDVVVVQHATLAPLVRHRSGRERWIIEVQNVGSQRSAQLAAVAGHWRHRLMWRRDGRRAKRLERWIAANYDLIVSVSDDDAAALSGTVNVIPNGVDLSAFMPTVLPSVPDIVLTASFNYPPNVDGAIWFCNEVLPRVRTKVADARVELVGREPGESDRRARRPFRRAVRLRCSECDPHLAAARVAIVPLRIGTGTRLKALEALAAGRPVAGTSCGLAGLGLETRHTAMIADEPADLAAAIVTLLQSDEVANAMARAGRSHVEHGFGWDEVGRHYADLVLGESVNGEPWPPVPPDAPRPLRPS